MGGVIRWPKHLITRLRRISGDPGVPYCAHCDGMGSELPTECPGYVMHVDERAAVANGHLDYLNGRWVAQSVEARRPL